MNFERNNTLDKISEKLGYIFTYFTFTIVLFLIINYIYKSQLSFLIILLITFIISLTGAIIKKFLK